MKIVDIIDQASKKPMKKVTAEVEFHWYCPKCERACLSHYDPNVTEWRVECSDCGQVYRVQVRPTKRAADWRYVAHFWTGT